MTTVYTASVNGCIDPRLGLDGTVASWSPAAERMYGYLAAEVLGRRVLLIVPPDRRRELDDLMARTLFGELIQGFDTVRVRKDGSAIVAEREFRLHLADRVLAAGSTSARGELPQRHGPWATHQPRDHGTAAAEHWATEQ